MPATQWRPLAGGIVALNDHQLSQIGLLAVLEAGAKSSVLAALRVIEKLSLEQWHDLERMQFRQIMDRLNSSSGSINDVELNIRLTHLDQILKSAQDMRHAIIHATWGQGGAEDVAVAYDYRRAKLLDAEYIVKALEECAELKRAAHWMTYRVAELIEQGVLTERPAGPGMSIRTATRLVRL